MNLIYPTDGTIIGYLAGCTRIEKKIIHLLLKHRDDPQGIRLSLHHIAKTVGCTIRTVSRLTTKLHNDGFIMKYWNPETDYHSANTFIFNDKLDLDKLDLKIL